MISGSRPSAYAELRLEGSRFVMTAYDVVNKVVFIEFSATVRFRFFIFMERIVLLVRITAKANILEQGAQVLNSLYDFFLFRFPRLALSGASSNSSMRCSNIIWNNSSSSSSHVIIISCAISDISFRHSDSFNLPAAQ